MTDRDRHWTILGSKTLLDDRWIRLRADRCETPGGRLIEPYYVLDYPDWVVVVAVTPARGLVLVRQYRHGAGQVLLECVAGGIEPEDDEPQAAAARELREETGYGCERLVPLGALYANPAMQTNRIHAFLAWNALPEQVPDLDAGEEGLTVECLPLETVLAGLGQGLIGQSMHVAAILLALPLIERLEAEDRLSKTAHPTPVKGGGQGHVVYGIDFTSTPSRRKPLTCAVCRLEDGVLRFERMDRFPGFGPFSDLLASPGPWIAGLDFPFGQARTFVETIGWPLDWAGYVALVAGMSRATFHETLTRYRSARAAGDKEHRRKVDVATQAISPQKLHGVPVGLMFFEGAPRLLASDVHIPLLRAGDPSRVVVEAYPGVLVRSLVGRVSYKNDARAKQTADQGAVRREVLIRLTAEAMGRFGFAIEAPASLAEDPSGDSLDALLCAVQAAWAWQQRENGYGIASHADPLEGWICDPSLLDVRA